MAVTLNTTIGNLRVSERNVNLFTNCRARADYPNLLFSSAIPDLALTTSDDNEAEIILRTGDLVIFDAAHFPYNRNITVHDLRSVVELYMRERNLALDEFELLAVHNGTQQTLATFKVVYRLFNPGSKLKTIDYLNRYLHVIKSVDSIYRFVDRLSPAEGCGIKEQVERISYAQTQKVLGGKVGVVFYDMTTLYFEAADEDDLRQCGFSKDGKHRNPQIFLGLLVAAGGNPIGYDIFEGNIHEGKTLVPMVESLANKFGFDHPVIIADAGLLSTKNIEALEEAKYQYILGARPKNDSAEVKKKILSMNLRDGQVRSFKRKDGRRVVVSMKNSSFSDSLEFMLAPTNLRLSRKIWGGGKRRK